MKPSLTFPTFVVVAFTAATLTPVPSALAQTAPSPPTSPQGVPSGSVDDNDEARRLYRSGVAAFDRDQTEEARRLLLQAWSIRRTYDVASVLGQVELALNLPRDAAEHLDFAVRNFPPQLSAEALQRVRDTFSQAEKRVGTLLVRVDRAGAQILVDGKPVGASPLSSPLFLDPGTHTVQGEEGGDRVRRTVNVEAGATQSLGLELGAARSPATPPTSTQAAREPNLTLLLLGGAVTLVGAGVGLGYAIGAADAHDRADAIRATLPPGGCGGPGPASFCNQLHEAAETHDRDRTLSTVAFAVSATALVATAGYWFLASSRPSQRTAETAAPVQVGASLARDSAAFSVSGAW